MPAMALFFTTDCLNSHQLAFSTIFAGMARSYPVGQSTRYTPTPPPGMLTAC